MKILIGNHQLGDIGGSETHAYTLATELKKQGHDVTALGACCNTGVVSNQLQKNGINCIYGQHTGAYDLILINHTSTAQAVAGCTGYKVQTCHGVYPQLEQPFPGMDRYVAISEEVQHHLKSKGYESVVIRNAIDSERFKPKTDLPPKLSKVLSLAHSEQANNIIKQACSIAGVKYMELCKVKRQVNRWDMENVINQADLVISLGRGVFESAACGRNVVVFDHRSYMNTPAIGDGFITLSNIDHLLTCNCSGRATKQEFNAESLAAELKKYTPEAGNQLRQYALEHLNIKNQARKYIELKK